MPRISGKYQAPYRNEKPADALDKSALPSVEKIFFA